MEINITIISVLVIVFLFIPGFFFKRFYYSGQFTKQFTSGTFAERFVTSMLWGIVVQCVAMVCLGYFTSLQYNDIRADLNKFYSEIKSESLPACTGDSFNKFIEFLIFTSVLGVVMGFISHKIVRVCRLDVIIPALRFSNHWNYYFKGDLPHMRDSKRNGKVISTLLDIVVQHDEDKTRLYRGFLADYTISHTTGELENIILANAERWSKTDGRFKPIKGDNLIIIHKTVLNLNLTYNIKVVNILDRMLRITMVAFLLLLIFLLISLHNHYNTLVLWKVVLLNFITFIGWCVAVVGIGGIFIEIQNRRSAIAANSPPASIYKIIFTEVTLLFIIFILCIIFRLIVK